MRLSFEQGSYPFSETNFQDFSRTQMFFQNLPGPVAFFQDFPVLENARIKFQDFPGFPGPIRTLFEGLPTLTLLNQESRVHVTK